ncbi:hypothetical protein P7D22_00865 [Lichenihabitans sp. Uapishka_5]|uniref:sulfotransferase n=1 Tax=Lichenihabitans sp. Uapishka_5 TaxID=3037302 RepID=UPI0029E7CEC9|nr:sulfotransferase [Lichenihabitans sp. Uapishka_5]MDX7949728.1 hypothetical protein [Lichenihabitans sp. Uapishka_5]
MAEDASRPASRKATSRLIYGTRDGLRHGRVRTALENAAACGIDRSLGGLGVARPVVLVSGFWRSGTTWLQESLAEALQAKTVFEPLSPMEPRRRGAMLAIHPNDSEDVRQATIPGPVPQGDAFWTYLDRTATGRIATSYLMSCRRDVAESMRPVVVLKDVRLQANLGGYRERCRTPVVHIRRHPGAVVSSLMTADWHWSFARAPLAVVLPRLGTALPAEQHEAALRFDTDALSRIVTFWAVTERIAAAALAAQSWGAVIRYEDFASDPAATLAGLCGRLGLVPRRTVDFSRPSATVHPDVFAAQAMPPRDRWRGVLSEAEADRVLTIANTLYPEWRQAGADDAP